MVYADQHDRRRVGIARCRVLLHSALRPAAHAHGRERLPDRGGARRDRLRARSPNARVAGVLGAAAAVAMLVFSPPWDRELLASGVYMYAPYVPKDLDLETLLKAGTLLYYREGAAATVSVKQLTGTTTLAVDGKVDASNRSDMLTQKLVAHLPLLLHDNPREVVIIGLGSGVTLGAALRHPIARADVVEISPEVVEASSFFAAENHDALDGSAHAPDRRRRPLAPAADQPQVRRHHLGAVEPWMAGVAALFTREFFAARAIGWRRGGIICQWAQHLQHQRRRSALDRRDVQVGVSRTARCGWSAETMCCSWRSRRRRFDDAGSANIERNWTQAGRGRRPRQGVGARTVLALVALRRRTGASSSATPQGATLVTDDRMTLEFSAPRELHGRSGGDNGAALGRCLQRTAARRSVREARAAAGAVEWRHRGTDDGQGRRAWQWRTTITCAR